jgi:hypothetical protein
MVVGTPETVAEHPTRHTADTSSKCWRSIRQRWWQVEWRSESGVREG